MRGMFLAILLLAAPLGVFALTWDFTEETTWGWAAQESWTVRIGWYVNGDDGAQRSGRRRVAHRTGTRL